MHGYWKFVVPRAHLRRKRGIVAAMDNALDDLFAHETRKGPDVDAMLKTIAKHHPASIHESLVALKEMTWRAMHSYVHGGIRAVAQCSMPFPHHEAGSVLINANGMLVLATNVVRMAHGLSSPALPLLQQQYADCLPNASISDAQRA